MNLLLKLNRNNSLTLVTRCLFAKDHKNHQKNKRIVTDYEKVQMPKPKEPQPEVKVIEHPIEQLTFQNSENFERLVLINMMVAGGIPFFGTVNAALLLINGGFILSQYGLSLKKFLILANTNHYEHLKRYKKPQGYLHQILVNTLFLSVTSLFVSFDYYSLTHIACLGWFGCNYSIFTNTLPEQYGFMIVPIFFILLTNYFADDIKKAIFPSKQQILVKLEEQARQMEQKQKKE